MSALAARLRALRTQSGQSPTRELIAAKATLSRDVLRLIQGRSRIQGVAQNAHSSDRRVPGVEIAAGGVPHRSDHGLGAAFPVDRHRVCTVGRTRCALPAVALRYRDDRPGGRHGHARVDDRRRRLAGRWAFSGAPATSSHEWVELSECESTHTEQGIHLFANILDELNVCSLHLRLRIGNQGLANSILKCTTQGGRAAQGR